jgi:Lon protease-like protein
MTRVLAMFPLGTVALPWTVLPLHIFEARYRTLMEELTDGRVDPPEFGIVLIERGSEVGGGDQRSAIGTVVRLVNHRQFADGRWLVLASGTSRVRVTRWLPDAPYPRAEVEDWPDEPLNDPGLLEDITRRVRRTLALAVELGDAQGEIDFTLADDPTVASWQVCAAAPLGPFDRQRLLALSDPIERLAHLGALVQDLQDAMNFRLSGEGRPEET